MKDIREARDPAMRGSLAALERAAEDARRIAIQNGTELIVMRNGQICSLPPEEIAKLPPVVEPPTATPLVTPAGPC
jgi:hypothetical protein